MMAKYFRLARRIAPLVFLAAAACDDSTAPGTGISATDQGRIRQLILQNTAVQEALGVDGDAELSGGFALGIGNVRSLGTITIASPSASLQVPTGVSASVNAPVRGLQGTPSGQYKAFGVQLLVTIGGETAVWTGVMALNQLNDPTDMLLVGAVRSDANTTAITTVPSAAVGTASGGFIRTASYVHITGTTTGVLYRADIVGGSGNVGLDASFGSGTGTSCLLTAFPALTVCNYKTGEVDASFNFTAKQVDGAATVVVPATTVSVPATNIELTYNLL